MTDLLYIIKKSKEESCTECVKQTDFEVYLEESYRTTINENKINRVEQTDFEKVLIACYPECQLNGTIAFPGYIGRSYHIIIKREEIIDKKEIVTQEEIAKIKARYKPAETELLIEGRKSAEVLAILKARNGFKWEEKDKHRKPNNTYTRTNTMEDIADYFHSM